MFFHRITLFILCLLIGGEIAMAQDTTKQPKTLGLCLSGGGALGYATSVLYKHWKKQG
jgi:hypothetical protein